MTNTLLQRLSDLTIPCPHCGTDLSTFTNNHLIAHLAFCRNGCCGRSLEHRFTGHRVAAVLGYHTADGSTVDGGARMHGVLLATVCYEHTDGFTGPYVADVFVKNLIAYTAAESPGQPAGGPHVGAVPSARFGVNPALTP